MSLVLLLGPQLQAFAAAGYEVHTASAHGPYAARLESWGIPHHPLRHATRAIAPRRDAAAAVELERLFRRIKPDIVHTHNPKPGIYGRLAARAAAVPGVVNTVHGLYATPDDPLGRRAVVYGLERLAAACSDAELVQNVEDLEVLARLGVPRARLHLLGNGVDLERFRPGRLTAPERAALRASFGAGPDDVVIGAVGRLVAEKGYPELFAAAVKLARLTPRLRVVVVGPDDPEKADALGAGLLADARAAGVTFLGTRDDVEDLYGAFDCYVLASHREGFPRSAIEAAASGLPVVATDIRGCRQVVEHGRTGLLVPARDAHALAAALAALAGDPGRRAAMGAAGRAKAERELDQARVIATTLAVYDSILPAPPSATAAPASVGGVDRRGAQDPAAPAPARGDSLCATQDASAPAPASGPVLRPARPGDVAAIAALHRRALPEAFLSGLGEAFLALLYRRMLAEAGCFVLVVDGPGIPPAGRLAGFVAGTEDTRRLYATFLLRDWSAALATAGPALARRAPRALESLRYGLVGWRKGWEPRAAPPAGRGVGAGVGGGGASRVPAARGGAPAGELLALAVAPAARRAGVGRALVEAFQAELAARHPGATAGRPLARVVLDEANVAACALYEGAGFRRWDVGELHRGRRSQILVWP